MNVKNKEVEEAKERAQKMIEDAEKNAQDQIEKKGKEEDKKAKAVLDSMPKPAKESGNDGNNSEMIRQIEG